MGAVCSVDEDEVAADQAPEDEVEVYRLGFKVREKDCEGDGGEEDSGEEGCAMAVVEVVASFEVFVMGRIDVEEAGVHQAIGGVEHPDGDGHCERGGDGQVDVIGGGDEPCPENSDGWSVEGEKMPEREGIRVVAYRFEGWFC